MTLTKERFDRDIAKHELKIIKNEGVYRYVHCGKPDSSDMHFEIVTFPGYMVYVGDMGAFTFWCTEDMFTFFRRADGGINPGYWSEKVEARDRDGIEKWSMDKFRANVISDAKSALGLEDGDELHEDAKEELEELLDCEDEWEAVTAIRSFDSERFDFTDFFEHDCTEYTTRFLWCCYAIVWAIAKFDEATNENAS